LLDRRLQTEQRLDLIQWDGQLMVNSRVLRKLRNGDLVRVAGLSRVIDPWIVEIIGSTGYDVIWLDLEHRAYGYDVVDPLSLACRFVGIDLMVRVRKADYGSPMRALEFGANGIMVPHCRSAEEARQWVNWIRFPPLGKRGFDGSGADADFGLADPLAYIEHANRDVFLALQIEDREAVEHIDEIADVEGFDLFFIGAADLSLSYGVPMQFDHPLLRTAFDRVANAACRKGKWWGTPTATPESAQSAVDRGARMITAGGDHPLLVRGFQKACEEFRSVRIRTAEEVGAATTWRKKPNATGDGH
jgi:4-hydroxy-2-oxoheptanedioate aldolase